MSDSIKRIGQLIRTQDNRITADPMFCVQEEITTYGFDPNYADGETVWVDPSNDFLEVSTSEFDVDNPGDLIETAKQTRWETVMITFTEEGCKEYIRLNGHNHRGKTRIYVESYRRCPEMIAIRKFLIKKAEELNELGQGD